MNGVTYIELEIVQANALGILAYYIIYVYLGNIIFDNRYHFRMRDTASATAAIGAPASTICTSRST